MLVPDTMVDLVAQSDKLLVNSEEEHRAVPGLHDTIQGYSSRPSTEQRDCTSPRLRLWSHFLTAIGFMRSAVAWSVAFPKASASQRTREHEEDPQPADRQHFGEDAQRDARVDNVRRQVNERKLQLGTASQLQDKEWVAAQRKDDLSLPYRVATALSKQNNVSTQFARPSDVEPPLWSDGDNGARCIARTNQRPSSPGKKHASNMASTISGRDVAPRAVGQPDFTEYDEDIWRHHKQLEAKMIPSAQYMKHQRELNWTMRAMLVEWIVQVHQRFDLRPETLFLGVNYVDRFLSRRVVSPDRLLLLGAASVLIAVKYEEGEPIPLSSIDRITSRRYGVEMIERAERMILTTLQFELGWPGPLPFLRRTLLTDGDDDRVRALAEYFLEVSLMDRRFVSDLPSRTAAVSHFIARRMLDDGTRAGPQTTGIFVPDHGHQTDCHAQSGEYPVSELKSRASLLLVSCKQPWTHHAAIFRKYSKPQFKRVATFVQRRTQDGFNLQFLQGHEEQEMKSRG